MKGKLLIAFVITGMMTTLFYVYSSQKDTPVEFVSGRAVPTNSEKSYKNTLLFSYETDPFWQAKNTADLSKQPEVVSASAYMIGLNAGEVLFAKNPYEKREIASLTKIMTAVVALEHSPLNKVITVSQKASEVGENSMGIETGETFTLEELLYGLVLHSGNDAAYAIAEGVAGDVTVFVDWMNLKGKELGLKDTYFSDVSGLDDRTYSTAFDLTKLTRYALKNPEFKKLVGTFETELYGEGHKYLYLQNQTNLLTTYPGVAGVKTGFTEEAGLCLVTYAQNDGQEVIGVVLNSIDRKGDMILMLDWGFENLGVIVSHSLL